MRLIDKIMQKHGYTKTEEDEYGVRYEKHEPQNYDHIVCVICKESGKHLMQSYDAEVKEVDGDFINDGCGVEIPVLLLMWLKAKYLAIKYHWKRRTEG
jgi:hypothetical protein